MKKLFLLLALIAFEVAAEPDLPDGYEYLMRISRPLEKVKDKEIYSVNLIKPLPEGFDGKALIVALSLLDLKKGQYVAFRNGAQIYVATEQKVTYKPDTNKEIESQTEKISIGATVEEATVGFESLINGVGKSESNDKTCSILSRVSEIIGGEAICVEDK